MRREFYSIYEDLYDVYSRSPLDQLTHSTRALGSPLFRWPFHNLRLARKVRRGIESGLSRTPNADRLRPDAKLVLLVNFTELVAKPLAHPGSGGDTSDLTTRLEEMVASDTKTILNEARLSNESNEITAGGIFKAIANVYERLGIRSLDLWG